MKIKFLGTSACDSLPWMFCNCRVCENARKNKGKEIRTRSQVLINEDMLIDFPSESAVHSIYHDINPEKINNILITHSHFDHFSPFDLTLRSKYNIGSNINKIDIYCNERTKMAFDSFCAFDLGKDSKENTKFHLLEKYDVKKMGSYTVYVIPVKHTEFERSFIYAINDGTHTYLHATDTDILQDYALSFISEHNLKFDLVAADCTYGNLDMRGTGHMTFDGISETRELLSKIGALNSKTKFVATHFSHFANLTHAELLEIGKSYDIKIAYDGLTVEL